MANTSYEYSKIVSTDRLTLEIQRDQNITVALDRIETVDESVTIWFRAALSEDEKTELDAVVANHVPAPILSAPVNSDNAPIVEVSLRRGVKDSDSLTLVTPDFTDRTSWYQNSVQVTGGSLTDTGDGLSFQAASGARHWVNINSPKLTLDYKKVPERDGSMSNLSMRYVTVYVNGTPADSSTYAIDFDLGKVTFNSSQTGNTITADYWHNDGVSNPSEFLINPPPGYLYLIEHVELQFSVNMGFTDIVLFEIWAGGTVSDYSDFNSFLFDAGYGQSRTYYRNMADLINWCNNEYPPIPKCGDFQQDILCFPFKFLVAPAIRSDQGTLIRIATLNGTPLTGEISTATIYMQKVKIE